MILINLVLIVLSLVSQNKGARILAVFPIPSISHQVVFRPLTLELAKRGHEVVVITPDPIFEKGKTPANFTEIDVHDLSYKVWKQEFLATSVTKGDKDDILTQLTVAFNMITRIFEMQLGTNEVQSIIQDKSRKFDLLIVEAGALVALGLSHIYKGPVIQISSFGALSYNMKTVGMPIHPLVYPTVLRQRIYNLTNWEKLVEVYNDFRLERIFQDCEEQSDKMLQRMIDPDIPKLQELKNNVDMLFLNVHPIWELNKPSPPNVIYMGGLHQKPVNELPKDLKAYLDSSKNGVIYISFGTNVEPAFLPPEKLDKFLKVFSKLPFDILWKWNQDDLQGRSENIKISKWLPQSDLLRHHKIRLFITQGGLQSTDESITAGVPLLGIPLLGDQWYNVEQYVYHKIGLSIDMETITEEKLENAINTIINNERTYRKNVANLRSLMRDQPETPLNRAVWWTEYVLRHGGAKHLRSPAANMPWTVYFELELLSYVIFTLTCVLFLVLYCVSWLWKNAKQISTSIKMKKS